MGHGVPLPFEQVSLSTILWMHQSHSMTGSGKVPGCCLPDGEEHSTR